MTSSRPNILFIMADQMQAPILPIYRDDSPVIMPNLKALADNGVVFDSAYTNAPLCAPSRYCLASARLPSKIGAWDNAATLASDVPTYAHALRSSGYHTALAGKMHFIGPDQLHGFEQRLTSDIYPADFGWTVDWRHEQIRADWYHSMASVFEAGPCYTSNQLDYDEEVSHQSIRYIWERARRHRSQPWCLTVSLTHPHDPYAAPEELWDLYKDVDIPMPEVEINQADQDSHSKRLLHVIDLCGQELKPEDIKRARRAYFANCTYIDNKIGKLVATLKQADLLDNTIIVFSGDHGDMLGERSLWYKMSFFEGSARVPLVFNYPKAWQPRRVSESVSTLDLFPTFVEMVGGTSRLDLDCGLVLDGRSLVPHITGERGGHDEVIGEYFGEGTISPLLMIRRGPWKFIYCDRDAPLLYNLEDDPKELVNRAQSDSLSDMQILSAFLDEIKLRWPDLDRLRKEVMDSQARRRYVASSLQEGKRTNWDFQPFFDASKEFIRNNSDQGILDEAETTARYPVVAPVAAQPKKPRHKHNPSLA